MASTSLSLRPFAIALLVAGATFLRTTPSAADKANDKQQCVAAYEEGQRLRKGGFLTAARERLLVCAQEMCPSMIKRDCTTWVAEVEQALPTVVFEAVGAGGKDIVDVKLSVDGRVVAEQMDGKAISLDPGAHVARFEVPGSPAVEERFVAREGEKSRRVVGRLAGSQADVEASLPTAGAPPRPIPVGTWVAGGVGVAGLGVFTVFAIVGQSEKSKLDDQGCKPGCPEAEVDKVKSKFLVADIGLAVGVAGLATAAVLYFTRPTVSATETAKGGVDFFAAPTASGGFAGAVGRF
jgi:hypothetical protein